MLTVEAIVLEITTVLPVKHNIGNTNNSSSNISYQNSREFHKNKNYPLRRIIILLLRPFFSDKTVIAITITIQDFFRFLIVIVTMV